MDNRNLARSVSYSQSIVAIALALCLTATSLPAQEPATSSPPVDAPASTPAATPRVVDYNNPTLEDILAAWREREEKVENYELVWDTVTENYRPYGTNGLPDWVESPVVYHTEESRIIATHDSLLYRSYGVSSRPENPPPVCLIRLNPSAMGLLLGLSGLDSASGRIHQTDHVKTDLGLAGMAPLLALYRPIWQTTKALEPLAQHEEAGVTLALLDTRDSEGRPVVEIEKPPRRYQFSIRQAAGFPPERIATFIDSGLERDTVPSTIDMVLEQHPIAGWAPKSWVYRSMWDAPAQLLATETSTVTAAQFNTAIPPRTFDHTYFPKGTIVRDVRNPDSNDIILQSDGDKLVPYVRKRK